MWIANQTRPDITIAVRAMARFSHVPKLLHCKAAQTILVYLNATSDLGLTFRRGHDFGSVHLEFSLKTYVDANYAHKVEDSRFVSGVASCFGGTLVSWPSRTQKVSHSIYHRGSIRSHGKRGQGGMSVRGILVFLMPGLGPMSIGVYEDNKGR